MSDYFVYVISRSEQNKQKFYALVVGRTMSATLYIKFNPGLYSILLLPVIFLSFPHGPQYSSKVPPSISIWIIITFRLFFLILHYI